MTLKLLAIQVFFYYAKFMIKLYNRYVYIYGKKTMYVKFSTIWNFRHLLGVLEWFPIDKGGLL